LFKTGEDQVAFAGHGFTVLEMEDNWQVVTAFTAVPLSTAVAAPSSPSSPATALPHCNRPSGGRLLHFRLY